MGHIHVQRSAVQSTKPTIQKLPTTTNPTNVEEKYELLEQPDPPRPGILLD